jgi:hypothetical protein
MLKKIIILVSLIASCIASAETTKIQNGFEVHYITFNSLSLSSEVAKNYQIERSGNRGYLNLSVLKQVPDGVSIPQEAEINISAKNLYGQNKALTLRKIAENDGAIYYISTFPISSKEIINFKAVISPVESKEVIEIKFSQEYFTD